MAKTQATMLLFKERKKRSRFLNSFILLMAILSMSYLLFIGINHIFRYNSVKQTYAKKYSLYQKEKALNAYYARQLEAMQYEAYWELQARRRLGYVKPGEHVYKFMYE